MHLPDSVLRLNHFASDCRRFAYCIVMIGLLAIGSSGSAWAASSEELGRFERLRAQDLRVASVAYRLSTANAEHCKLVLAPQLGFVLHSIKQYAPDDRADAVQSFGLTGHVGVMAVVAASPAQAGGLRANDQLLSVNGRTLAVDNLEDGPGRASVERTQAIVVEAMRRGQVTLRVSGPKGEREVHFAAKLGCPLDMEFIPGAAVNAWADGSRVMVSEGLFRRCRTDDDLALVVGHEMAHNLLHHRRRLAAEGIAVSGLLPLTAAGSREMRETEEEADRLAVRLAAAAGYDLSDAEAFMGGLLDRALPMAGTHPAPDRRLALLRAAIADTTGNRPRAATVSE